MKNRIVRVTLFTAAAALFLCNLSRDYSWDVMERACFLKHPSEAPAWGLFFFAHLLEIPLAAGLGRLLPFVSEAVMLLQILECLFGALLVLLLYDFCVAIKAGQLLSLLAACILPASFGFWRMATAGEEKVIAAFFITLFLYLYTFYPRGEHGGENSSFAASLYVGFALGLASLVHLMALILWPFLLIVIALERLGLKGLRFGIRDSFVIMLVGLLIFVLAAGMIAVFYYGLSNPQEILKGFLAYHSPTFPFWYFAQPAQHRSLLGNMRKSVIGIERVIFPDGVVNRHARATALLIAPVMAGTIAAALKRARKSPLIPVFLAFLALWACAYLFYEPRNPESWICAYPSFILLVCAVAAASGPGSRRLAASAFPAALSLLLLVNCRYYSALRAPSSLELCARSLDTTVPPGAIIVVGDGIEQRYVRYFSHCTIVLADHLRSGKFDWFDSGRVGAREFRMKIDEGRPAYATARGLKRLPAALLSGVRWKRVDCGKGVNLYRLEGGG